MKVFRAWTERESFHWEEEEEERMKDKGRVERGGKWHLCAPQIPHGRIFRFGVNVCGR